MLQFQKKQRIKYLFMKEKEILATFLPPFYLLLAVESDARIVNELLEKCIVLAVVGPFTSLYTNILLNPVWVEYYIHLIEKNNIGNLSIKYLLTKGWILHLIGTLWYSKYCYFAILSGSLNIVLLFFFFPKVFFHCVWFQKLFITILGEQTPNTTTTTTTDNTLGKYTL